MNWEQSAKVFCTRAQGRCNQQGMGEDILRYDRCQWTSFPDLFSGGRRKLNDVVVPHDLILNGPSSRTRFSRQETKREKVARRHWHQDRRRVPQRVYSSTGRSQTDGRRCLRQTVALRGHREARIRSCTASHLHFSSMVQSHVAALYENRLISI